MNANAQKKKIVVIIINYRTPQLTLDCLESLIPELMPLEAKVVVVDNDSRDDSCEIIQNWIDNKNEGEQVELIASVENTGFSGGNNCGIRHINAEYYLLLNSDTLLRKGAISLLLDAVVKEPSAGLVSPRLEWPDGTPQESCFRFHTPISELIGSATTGPITRLFKKFNVPCRVSNKSDFYEWTSFACVLVKSEVFNDVGLMDDGYFMYFEDVAFAYRAQQLGWKVLNVPKAHVVHLRGGSSPVKSQTKQRKRLPRYYYESRTRFFYQLYGYSGLLLANLLWTLGWGISLFRQLLSASFRASYVKLKWRDIWTNFLNPLASYIHPNDYEKT